MMYYIYCAWCDNQSDEARRDGWPPVWQRVREEGYKQVRRDDDADRG
jgi:hypothetical protein